MVAREGGEVRSEGTENAEMENVRPARKEEMVIPAA